MAGVGISFRGGLPTPWCGRSAFGPSARPSMGGLGGSHLQATVNSAAMNMQTLFQVPLSAVLGLYLAVFLLNYRTNITFTVEREITNESNLRRHVPGAQAFSCSRRFPLLRWGHPRLRTAPPPRGNPSSLSLQNTGLLPPVIPKCRRWSFHTLTHGEQSGHFGGRLRSKAIPTEVSC